MDRGEIPEELRAILPALMMQKLMGGDRSDSEYETAERAYQVREEIKAYGESLSRHTRKLASIGEGLAGTFEDETVVFNLVGGGRSLEFFPQMHANLTEFLSEPVNKYLEMSERYSGVIKGRLEGLGRYCTFVKDQEAPERGERPRRDYPGEILDPSEERMLMRVARETEKMHHSSVELYVRVKKLMPRFLAHVRKSFAGYNKYLKARFLKSDDDVREKQKVMQVFMRGDDPDEALPQYVKVKFYQGSPVLTDILLNLIDTVPDYKEVPITTGKKKGQARKVLSHFQIEESAEKLASLSDPRMLEYLSDPNKYFKILSRTLGDFYQVFKSLEPSHERLLDKAQISVLLDGEEILKRNLKVSDKGASRDIARIKSIDLDSIVQDEDDVSPDNRSEAEVFKYRTRLFDLLYKGMAELSEIGEYYDRRDAAEKIITEAVELKDKMKIAAMTENKRRLRHDKLTDNEFYVGRQVGHGQFIFERKPSPEVRMEEVIGASFDEAKVHLDEIIKTGEQARVLRMSAPGRRVKSNILLIGPYGCGKTELGRAVLGDERVIGASVSVANTLTAFMHESVGNVKRIYDQLKTIHDAAMQKKPAALFFDEFDAWFKNGHSGVYGDVDMGQIQDVFLEVLDGIEDYSGIITIGATNKPLEIPHGLLRRFRFVDIVGKLTHDERKQILGMYLERSLPLHEEVPSHYDEWCKKLENAPGDVVRKVVDEVHFKLVPPFIDSNPRVARRLERTLQQREVRKGKLTEKDSMYLKDQLRRAGCIVSPDLVSDSLDKLLRKPNIVTQINDARDLYEDADRLLSELGRSERSTFGLRHKSGLIETGD